MGIETLSERQKQVLRLVGQNHQAKEIARLLDISESTVKTHMEEGRRRLGIGTSREAARFLMAQESGTAIPLQGGYPSGRISFRENGRTCRRCVSVTSGRTLTGPPA